MAEVLFCCPASLTKYKLQHKAAAYLYVFVAVRRLSQFPGKKSPNLPQQKLR